MSVIKNYANARVVKLFENFLSLFCVRIFSKNMFSCHHTHPEDKHENAAGAVKVELPLIRVKIMLVVVLNLPKAKQRFFHLPGPEHEIQPMGPSNLGL